jgi:hypothetical protein
MEDSRHDKGQCRAFTVPVAIEPNLARVWSYWKGLLRGDNKVPFWDDVNLSSLAGLAEDAMMLDVFDNPLRFRLAIIGRGIEAEYDRSVSGKFVDELEQRPSIEHLEIQCLPPSNANRRLIFMPTMSHHQVQDAVPG